MNPVLSSFATLAGPPVHDLRARREALGFTRVSDRDVVVLADLLGRYARDRVEYPLVLNLAEQFEVPFESIYDACLGRAGYARFDDCVDAFLLMIQQRRSDRGLRAWRTKRKARSDVEAEPCPPRSRRRH